MPVCVCLSLCGLSVSVPVSLFVSESASVSLSLSTSSLLSVCFLHLFVSLFSISLGFSVSLLFFPPFTPASL